MLLPHRGVDKQARSGPVQHRARVHGGFIVCSHCGAPLQSGSRDGAGGAVSWPRAHQAAAGKSQENSLSEEVEVAKMEEQKLAGPPSRDQKASLQ